MQINVSVVKTYLYRVGWILPITVRAGLPDVILAIVQELEL